MLLSCGDALIDFLPASTVDGRDAYVPAVGGSCLNVAAAIARLGAPSGLVGGISTDLFGAMIADHAQRSNVDLSYALRTADQTTLAFVTFADGGLDSIRALLLGCRALRHSTIGHRDVAKRR